MGLTLRGPLQSFAGNRRRGLESPSSPVLSTGQALTSSRQGRRDSTTPTLGSRLRGNDGWVMVCV